MVRALRDEGAIATDRVAAASAAAPRHLFTPGQTLEAAYAPHGTVMPKRDADGQLLSVLSAPNSQAMMLEPTGIEPGMRTGACRPLTSLAILAVTRMARSGPLARDLSPPTTASADREPGQPGTSVGDCQKAVRTGGGVDRPGDYQGVAQALEAALSLHRAPRREAGA